MTDKNTDVRAAGKTAPPDDPTGAAGETALSGADELDAALKEFDEGVSETKPERKGTEASADAAEVARLLKEEREERLRDRQEKELQDVYNAVKGDLDVDDQRVRRFVQGEAAINEGVRRAWSDRHNKPEAFQKVLKALSKQFAQEVPGQIDQDATDTEEAVRAAVRSASTKTEDKPLTREQWRKMSPDERRKLQAEHGVTPV